MKLTYPAKAPKSSVGLELSYEKATHLRTEGALSILVLHVGKNPLNPRTLRTTVRNIIRTAMTLKIDKLVFDISLFLTPALIKAYSRDWVLSQLAENILMASYEFNRYRTRQEKGGRLSEVAITGASASDRNALSRGETIGIYVNACRDIANTPGGDMTPRTLAHAAKQTAKGTSVSVRILNKKQIEREKMGALLGVSKGSVEEPRFIIMEYWGAGRSSSGRGKNAQAVRGADKNNPIVFVGKGITFDTGGVNIKPSDGVLDMHLDMSGGAAVMSTISLAAKLKLKKNIVGLIPAAENMVSGSSYRPGDVLRSMSGTTIDVLNTDAEGRLVLADGLTYAERYTPRLVVDIATLTGAALVAVGLHASTIMTKDIKLQQRMQNWGEESGDYVWPLPLWDEYKQYTKGVFGDIANIPSSHGRYGGSINGGMFLSHFTEKYPWVHIDMAPRMSAAPGDHLAKGAAGEPVRLLLKIAENY